MDDGDDDVNQTECARGKANFKVAAITAVFTRSSTVQIVGNLCMKICAKAVKSHRPRLRACSVFSISSNIISLQCETDNCIYLSLAAVM